jgi:prevent-host-death family protein
MIRVNVHDAKTHFSKYLEAAEKGETVIICRRNKPVAQIRPLDARKRRRPIGPEIAGYAVPDSAFDPMTDEELADWYDAPLVSEE